MRLLNRVGLNYAIGGYKFQPESKAFITASGITDPTQKTAVDYLVKQLKANNLYSKFSVLYPFVGGTAHTHKYNLINPADSDAAFRIVWSGSVTHDANGIKSNGTNGYGDAKYNPVAASASLTSFSMGIYKTGIEANGTSRSVIGNLSGTGSYTILGWVSSGTKIGGAIGAASSSEFTPTETIAQSNGIQIINVSGSRVASLYSNSGLVGTHVTQTGAFADCNIFVLALNNNGTPSSYRLETIVKLAYISTGMTAGEISTLISIITAYQTMLGRN